MESDGKDKSSENSLFRDRMVTVDEEGSRVWVYPKKPKGKLFNYRKVVAYTLLAFFYVAPHIQVNGNPLIFLNFLQRKFILFGSTFYPQDFYLLVLASITLLVFVILFTVVYGRIFCGWVCPQTVFLEFLYRPIEYLIDGDRRAQIELARQEMTPIKLIKRLLKHSIYLAISFWTILTFLSYIIGYSQVKILMIGWPTSHFSALIGVLAFTGAHYYVFAWFREQVCSLACPYGRLQGVMLDTNSIVVAYDYIRGEPRGRGKNEDKGDCIDCKRCVDVCPAGIDIRNGTQLECINCTACIDACNSVMYAVNKPKGLIRYASERSISERKKHVLNARAIAYSVVLVILLGVVSYSFINRGSVDTTIVRMQGSMYQEYGNDAYSNVYNMQMINKTNETATMSLKLLSPAGELKILGNKLVVKKGELAQRNLLIFLPRSELKNSNTHIEIGVFEGGKMIDKISSTFVGPNALDNPK
ncbi:MAG TPA: cytochrome c oxidase accessory protein CcoG [Sunxiuqinia sp.]|nr:cytochrome c oxidase accessory protein CcoG [Sunxiuqinia sp.]